jgi:hypothetical protein
MEAAMSWASKLVKPYRVEDGTKFRLKDFDPEDTGNIHSKEDAEELLANGIAAMAELQDTLYAQQNWGVLLIFRSGVLVQDSVVGGTGSRLFLAYLVACSRTRSDRHLQSLLLRRSIGGKGSSGVIEE